jgi:membrane protease YdiL (CAAX protease family)
MKLLLQLLSYLCLALTVVPALLVFAGTLPLDQHETLMAVGMVGWFVVTPFWMRKKAS